MPSGHHLCSMHAPEESQGLRGHDARWQGGRLVTRLVGRVLAQEASALYHAQTVCIRGLSRIRACWHLGNQKVPLVSGARELGHWKRLLEHQPEARLLTKRISAGQRLVLLRDVWKAVSR